MSVEERRPRSRFRGVTNNGSGEPPRELTTLEKLQKTYAPQKASVITDKFGRAQVPEEEIRQAMNNGGDNEVGVGDNVIFVGEENNHRWRDDSV